MNRIPVISTCRNEKKLRKEKIDAEWRKKVREKDRRENEKKERIEKQKILAQRWAILKWVNEFLKENHERWEKERENREKEIEKELEDWDRTKRHEKLRILKEKMNNKNVAKLEELERQEKEKWTVWQERGKLEDRKDLPVPPGARISPRRQSEETLGDNKTKSRTINEYLIKKPRLEFQSQVGENNMSLPVPEELESQIGRNEGSLLVPKEVEKENENLPEKPHEKTPLPLKISPKTQLPQSPKRMARTSAELLSRCSPWYTLGQWAFTKCESPFPAPLLSWC